MNINRDYTMQKKKRYIAVWHYEQPNKYYFIKVKR